MIKEVRAEDCSNFFAKLEDRMLLNLEPIQIQDMLNSEYTFYAHKKEENGLEYSKYETLKEHTQRCVNHFKNIIKSKGLESIFLNFEKKWLQDCDEEQIKLFRHMLLNTIVFHDIGKINPLYQKDRMKNQQFAKSRGNIDFGSRHSLISSIFYLEYFLLMSHGFPPKIRKRFRILTCINAYIISKHHGSLDNFEKFISDFLGTDEYKDKLEILHNEYGRFLNDDNFLKTGYGLKIKIKADDCCSTDKSENIFLYIYEKLMYSLLIASDYYATSEYSDEFVMESHGTIDNIKQIIDSYEKSEVVQSIRNYEKIKIEKGLKDNKKDLEEWWKEKDINILKSELFLDAEKMLERYKEQHMFYLEAPTGIGKSNTALNLSFQLIKLCPQLNKIWYIYPFNTLVEQNIYSMGQIFGNQQEILNKIAVVNSITPISYDKEMEEEKSSKYSKALLDRQFFNYPITLSTHITFFDILFGDGKESGFGFYQLANSIVVLDEIQSYRNEIWTEIIVFLKGFAELLNMKIIIMSATLPDLDLLSIEQAKAVKLIEKRQNYFLHPLFKDRVQLRYELLESKNVLEDMVSLIKQYLFQNKKILVEFLSKKTAERFYRKMCEDIDITCKIRLITGDDNSIERKNILHEIEEEPKENGFLLIATQVVEAGVDIQAMEIGFKDISTIDSEEQFMGRINRSCKSEGIVYFFNLDKATLIYGNDVRLEKELTLESDEMKNVLKEKLFMEFYEKVFDRIIQNNNSLDIKKNTNKFFAKVGSLDIPEISERMRLIKDTERNYPVFLAREIKQLNGETLDGKKVWNSYSMLLKESTMGYAQWRIELSQVKSQMNYFIYNITKNTIIPYNDQIGEIYYIENGEQYFENGKLNRDKLVSQTGAIIQL